jgi:cell division protein FtsL
MFYKLAILVICATLTGMALLMLRHHRYETMYEMAQTQRQITQIRQQLWEQQSHIAKKIEPQKLQETLASSELPLKSVVGVNRELVPQIRTASKLSDIPVP